MIRFNLSSFSLSSLVFFFLFLLENENKENKLISISTLSMKEKNWKKCFWIRIFCSFSKKFEILSSPASVFQFFLESKRSRKNEAPLSFYFPLISFWREEEKRTIAFCHFSLSRFQIPFHSPLLFYFVLIPLQRVKGVWNFGGISSSFSFSFSCSFFPSFWKRDLYKRERGILLSPSFISSFSETGRRQGARK